MTHRSRRPCADHVAKTANHDTDGRQQLADLERTQLVALDAAPLAEDGLWGSASRRDEGLGWRLAAEDAITSRGEPADEPVRLDGIVHPGGGPAVGYARFNRLLRHFAAVTVEKRQLPASLRQSALEIASLRVGRP
jgi:hypothetical protein